MFSAGDDVGLGVRSFHSEHDRSGALRSGSLAAAPGLRERHGGRQAAMETGVLAISGYGGGGGLPWVEAGETRGFNFCRLLMSHSGYTCKCVINHTHIHVHTFKVVSCMCMYMQIEIFGRRLFCKDN